MTGNGASPVVQVVFPADVDSSVTREECAELASLAEGLVVLELGAWLGRTTIVFAQVADNLHSVDWHRGDRHAGEGATLIPYVTNLNRYGILANPKVTVHVARFDELLPLFRPGAFDMVFLDGFHTYDQVAADIELALPLLAAGGTFAFHDYGVDERGFGVTRAVDERFHVDRVVGTVAVVTGIDADGADA